MGDRIGLCVRDCNGETSSVIIHSHWMGKDLLKYVQQFMKDMKDSGTDKEWVGEIITHFIIWLTVNNIDHDITIEDNEDDCEDNGIFEMNFQDMTVS